MGGEDLEDEEEGEDDDDMPALEGEDNKVEEVNA